MSVNTQDAQLLRRCFRGACASIEKNRELINELNVFPVPDGDTGTNVSMTLMSALNEVNAAPVELEAVCKAMSQGSLRGARGNSGVIFSQLIRGFSKALLEAGKIDRESLAASFKRAAETAYKAVMKPKEGTILTVARGMSERMQEKYTAYEDLVSLLEDVTVYGDEVLDKTPEMLPVLKEAGVVDSGGMALMTAMKGALSALKGEEPDISDTPAAKSSTASAAGHVHISTDDIKYGYCTECIVNLNEGTAPDKVHELKHFLLGIGDSVVCVEDEEVVKIHVHTNHPGLVFEKGLELGSLSRIKVDNLHEEHQEKLIRDASKLAASEPAESEEPLKDRAIVAVCAGAEIADIMRELGADYVVEGGQTMNPSIQDILCACEKVRAKEVFVLPNNKNIILASEQAGKNTDGKFDVITVPTKTVVQGISAILSYDPELSTEEAVEAMTEALSNVRSGEVTYAIRNTCIDGMEIREGDFMGIGDSGILSAGNDLNTVTLEMIRKMTDEDSSVIGIYYGADTDEETALKLKAAVEAEYGMCDVDLRKGGQPVYYYFVSVE